ncbi:hypothetical protein HB364_17070 [Pseudoflavitalea sp. X16]|uniref:hypothetical protein n=1 Tax=Paraflavitalea devenefica TaxID=2716334 RepID=UPI00141E24B8|nr:hypothetical protein [Paraflavitalea devenefica]NII26804.1 hypothetical protein [Paraflavitalea devenefica]
MNSFPVHINFETMASALREYVRRKAIKAESTIFYVEKGQLIEENPKSHTKVALKKAVAKS